MSHWIIDAGNTRLKLREIVHRQVSRSITIAWPQVDPWFIQSISGEFALVSQVVTNHKLVHLLKRFKKIVKIDHQLIRQHFNFQTQYDDPNQLGIDRLLAALGANIKNNLNEKVAVVAVINAGTATTIELSEQHTHLGGMIIAGNQLMLNALANAEKLPQLYVQNAHKIGTDSSSSIQAGLTIVNQGLVLGVIKAYKVDKIFVCGGNAKQFEGLDDAITIIPDLIMQTMATLHTKLIDSI